MGIRLCARDCFESVFGSHATLVSLVSGRVGDTGLSVRKRAVRILRDVCLKQGMLSRR